MEGVRLEEILRKAELLSGGPLPEDPENPEALTGLAELAARQAMAVCGREDVPEDMEQAVAALLLSLPGGRGSGEDEEEGDAEAAQALASGAVKSIQRGDTTIVYATDSAAAGAQSGSTGSAGSAGTALPAAIRAVDWSPWRRLGRLRRD